MESRNIPGRVRARSDANRPTSSPLLTAVLSPHKQLYTQPLNLPAASTTFSPTSSSPCSDWTGSWQDCSSGSLLSTTTTTDSLASMQMRDHDRQRERVSSFSSDASQHRQWDNGASGAIGDNELLFDLETEFQDPNHNTFPEMLGQDFPDQLDYYINWPSEDMHDDVEYLNYVVPPRDHQLSNYSSSAPPKRFCHVHVSTTDGNALTIQEHEETDPHMTASTETVKVAGGRKGPLSEKSKADANMMRKIRNCTGCKKHKNKCDPGNPCKPCINRYGTLLLSNPCRGDIAANVVALLLDSVKWHPSARREADVFGKNFHYIGETIRLPISLGFGTPLCANVHLIQPHETAHSHHKHVWYRWPPVQGELTIPAFSVDTVLPAAFDQNDDLEGILDRHLGVLVESDFRYFPYFASQFHVLSLIWGVFNHYRQVNPEYSELLKAALKLLTLVHIGGDACVDPSDMRVQQILFNYSPGYSPTPSVSCCFLRAQLGTVMPGLAARLLRKVVTQLAGLALDKKCGNFLIVNCLFAVLMMTIETIEYHAAKEGLHANYDLSNAAETSSFPPNHATLNPSLTARHSSRASCEQGADMLLRMYKNCFENCHRQMLFSQIEPEDPQLSSSAPKQRPRGNSMRQRHGTTSPATVHFVSSLKEAISGSRPYLEQRSQIGPERLSDMSLYFDRLLARLYLLKID